MDEAQQLQAYVRELCAKRCTSAAQGTRGGFLPDEVSDRVCSCNARLEVARAVLLAAERYDSDNLPSLTELRSALISAALHAGSIAAEPRAGAVDVADVMTAEGQAIASAIADVPLEFLRTQRPLPYQRVLSSDECDSLWHDAEPRWVSRGRDGSIELVALARSELVTFGVAEFEQVGGSSLLRRTLRDRGCRRLFQLASEDDEGYEIDMVLFTPASGGGDRIWLEPGADWIVVCLNDYVSQIAVGGTLVEPARAAGAQAR